MNKCELCGYESDNLGDLHNRKLCYQCWMGEAENPEHNLAWEKEKDEI